MFELSVPDLYLLFFYCQSTRSGQTDSIIYSGRVFIEFCNPWHPTLCFSIFHETCEYFVALLPLVKTSCIFMNSHFLSLYIGRVLLATEIFIDKYISGRFGIFQRRGRQPQRGSTNLLFAENCMKMKEFEPGEFRSPLHITIRTFHFVNEYADLKVLLNEIMYPNFIFLLENF